MLPLLLMLALNPKYMVKSFFFNISFGATYQLYFLLCLGEYDFL